jgi:hypothetical protein
MSEEIQKFLKGVETVENGPVVISPYGFKRIMLHGKTYLTAMTREERLALEPEDSPARQDPLYFDDGCNTTHTGGCLPGQPGHCELQCSLWSHGDAGIACTCR